MAGGRESFLLAALDDRISLSFPAVMVSTGMQGGCTCENACGLRIGTGNVEIAALFAPKPQGLTSADDWTREMESKGFPELRKLYQLMGAGDRVSLKPLTHFGHNYNAVSRHAMYEWVNKHFDLNQNSPILEKNFTRLTRDQMSVWNDNHPVPPSGEEFEVDLLKRMAESNMKYLLDLAESDPEKLRSILLSGWQVVVGRRFADSGQVKWKLTGKSDKGTYLEMSGTLDNTTYHESLPVVFLHPKSQWNGRTRLLISSRGKSALYNPDGSITAEVAQYLAKGSTVLGVDLFHQGEFLDQGQDVSQTRSVENPRESAAYTLGYNHSLCAQRIHDVMTTVQFLHTFEKGPSKVDLSSDREAAPIALAAAALAGADKVHSLDADTGDFAFHEIHSIRHPDFLPGATRFGDVRGLKFILGIED
ncbi:MAG: hypothetical protein LR011_01035 [Verrucomicrobia bacterium]|nr:hypothetical protein [Verrucomicrobiota bacterium]